MRLEVRLEAEKAVFPRVDGFRRHCRSVRDRELQRQFYAAIDVAGMEFWLRTAMIEGQREDRPRTSIGLPGQFENLEHRFG